VLEGQLRQNYGRIVYSHKTHEKCADIQLARLGRIKFWQIVLSGLSAAGFVGAILGAGPVTGVIGAGVSATLLALNAYTKDYDLGELAQKHRQAAHELWLVREEYLSLLSDIALGTGSLESLQARRDALILRAHSAYGGAPSTSSKAYEKARTALKQHEEMTFSDSEIDAFLPAELKRQSSNEDGQQLKQVATPAAAAPQAEREAGG